MNFFVVFLGETRGPRPTFLFQFIIKPELASCRLGSVPDSAFKTKLVGKLNDASKLGASR